MGEWQLIDENTPKDTPVIVGIEGGDYHAMTAEMSNGYWRIPDTNRVLLKHPTHWQPLPEPPTQRATDMEAGR